MLFPSATVVAAMVLSLAGASPLEAKTASRGETRSAAAAPIKLAAGLWAPKKAKPRPAKDEDAREEELLKSRAPAASDPASKPRRRPIKMDDSQEEEEDGAEEGEEEDEEDRPRVTKRRKRVVEEEEDEAPEPIASQPSVIPRAVYFQLGPAIMRRALAYNVGTQQGDKGFRLGYQFGLESFPLVSRPNGWYRTLGVGAWYEKEYGSSTRDQPSGVFMGASVNHSRWGFDARYAIPAGEWVIIMPALGYSRVNTDLQRMTPTAPSACTSTTPEPCFGDIKASYVNLDLHVRVGLTPRLALSLAGGYMLGMGVARGMDQITASASAATNGFHVDLGASLLIGNYFAVQAMIPFRRQNFSFGMSSDAAFTAKTATDTYYGVIGGFAVLTP